LFILLFLVQRRSLMGKKMGRKKLIGILAIGLGAVGTAGAFLVKRRSRGKNRSDKGPGNLWARPGMKVVFRAELKPGRDAAERTFQVVELLSNGRVILEGISGEHTESEFEPIRYTR
jgi:hypothetical protein